MSKKKLINCTFETSQKFNASFATMEFENNETLTYATILNPYAMGNFKADAVPSTPDEAYKVATKLVELGYTNAMDFLPQK